jgi:Ca-activated chloride channel homolog
MTGDLDDLKAALRTAPAADPAAKAAALRLAMENFDRLQGSASDVRFKKDHRTGRGFWNGVLAMMKTLNNKPLLAATTSAAALCVGMVVLLPLVNRGVISGQIGAPEVVVTEGQTPAAPQAATNEQVATEGRDVLAEVVKPRADAPVSGKREAIVDTEADAAGGALLPSEPAPAETMVETMADATEAPLAKMAPEAAMPSLMPRTDVGALVPERGELAAPPPENTESYANAPANPVKVTVEEPVSTFSIDVDTASYAIVRSSLNAGFLPDSAAVRVEEMVNYFPYAYPAPEVGEAFRPTVTVLQTPWNPGTRLVHIGIQGALPAVAERPPLNLVFLIDTSGSMEDPNKLPLLKQSLALLLPELRPEDQVAIVAYAGSAGQVLPPTPAADRRAILGALDNLSAGGSTAGAEGIALAYQVAKTMATEGEVSRVLLATDGDFNVGIDDPEALKTFIAAERDSGVYLSVLGFGRGNLDDATMQALAQNGNGMAAYIDTLTEARKVLVDQLTGALFPIADNVKIQVEWNPAEVAEYRLIGYETRALRREDFNNDRVDAGDIGAGTQVTAIYEITAPGSAALRNDPLRYGATQPVVAGGELGFLRLRHVTPGASASQLSETAILPQTAEPGAETRFAVAMAGFGQLLTGATYLGDWDWDKAIALAQSGRGEDPFGYRAEAVTLMRLAEALAQ